MKAIASRRRTEFAATAHLHAAIHGVEIHLPVPEGHLDSEAQAEKFSVEDDQAAMKALEAAMERKRSERSMHG